MYRLGHTGIALLVLAPLSYVLLEAHKPLLALVTVLGVIGIEPLPDLDFKLPFLTHRGISHSLLAAVVVGGVVGLCGWVATGQVAPTLASGFTAVGEAVRTGATSLQSLTPSGAPGRIAGLLRALADSLGGIGSQLRGLDRQMIAGYGFAIGAGGILVHLLGDVITVSGIRPLLPISSWRVSLSSLRAKSTFANTGLFAGGVIAIAVVLSLTVGGAAVAGMPADLSPIGTVHAQDASDSTYTGSFQVNATTANRTASQNQTQNASTPTTVEFANQTSNGSTITIRRVTLSQLGFIAIHTPSYVDGLVGPNESIIAVSQRLSPGTHRNVTVDISHAPPGNPPGLNRSRVNETQTLAATVYGDTNGNSQLDIVRSFGENDTFVTANGSVVRDTARVRVPSPPRRTASVTFRNQTLQNGTLIVAKARLPRGGFLIAHNESYRRTGDAVTSAVAISRYLPPGNYSNVTLSVAQGALADSQVVTIRPSLDTNDNHRYDFVRSDGFADIAYETRDHSAVVNDTARVRSPNSDAASTPHARESETTSSPLTRTEPSKPHQTTTTTTANSIEKSDSDTTYGFSPLYLLAGGVIVLVVLLYLSRRFR